MTDRKTNTVTITQEMLDERPLVMGPSGNIATMPEDEARAIFGDEFYEAWVKAKSEGRPSGTCTVIAIDRDGATVTVGGWSGVVIKR